MLLELQRIDVQRFILLRGAHVMQHGSGRNRRRLVAVQPESLERMHIQLPLDKRHGKLTPSKPSPQPASAPESSPVVPESPRLQARAPRWERPEVAHRWLAPEHPRHETPRCETRPSRHPAAPARKPIRSGGHLGVLLRTAPRESCFAPAPAPRPALFPA